MNYWYLQDLTLTGTVIGFEVPQFKVTGDFLPAQRIVQILDLLMLLILRLDNLQNK